MNRDTDRRPTPAMPDEDITMTDPKTHAPAPAVPDDVAGLIERLRLRSKYERYIQANNAAVAELLQPQIDAFNRRDGTHNLFALRLALEHKNCAENEGKLVEDWDAAIATIEALTAELARLRRDAIQIALQAIQNMPGAGPFTEEGKDDDWRFRARLARKEALDAAQAHIMLAFEQDRAALTHPTGGSND